MSPRRAVALSLVLAAALPTAATAEDRPALSAEEIGEIQSLRRDGKFDDALDRIDAHPAIEAEDEVALALRGLILLDSGRDGAARLILGQRFRSARVVSDALPNTFLARLRFRGGDAKRGKSRAEAALVYDAESAEARFLRDASAAQLDADPAAILALRKFDGRDGLPKGLLEETVRRLAGELGTERARDGASDDATWTLLRTALDGGDDDAGLQLLCARVLHRRGDREAAEELLDDVAKRRPHRMQDVLFERGLAQSERGEKKEAFETLNGAVVLGKDHAELLTLASELALDLDRLEEASRLLSLLEARIFSIDVDRLYARYCETRAAAIPADDEKQRGNRIVLLREAEKRCIAALKKDRFHVESLERLLRVSEQLGAHSKVDRDGLEKQLRSARQVAKTRAKAG